ncbi:MAG: DUF3096 domain-containing protein [Actinobacteria bacterium]|nr:DUF3096 domain-containing protein [Actinomycetota bacterium]
MDLLLLLAQEGTATFDLTLTGILALVAGIVVLLFPKILNYVVGIYLIVVGLVDIFDLTL